MNNDTQAVADQPEIQQAESTNSTDAQMEAAAKEASMIVLDKLIGESQAQAETSSETSSEAEAKPVAEEQPKPKPAKKAPAKLKATTEEAAKPEPEPEAEEETKEEEPAPKPKRRSITAEKVAEMASKAAAEAAADTMRRLEEARMEQQRKEQARAEKEAEPDVPDALKEDVERLKEVQRLHAKEYRGRDLVKEFLDSTHKEVEYERNWRRKNPGQEFDWSDEEHAEFVDTNSVEVDEDHLKEADRSMIKEAAIREAEERFAKKYGQDIEAVRRTRQEAELAPIRQQVDRMASISLLEAVRPDLVELANTDPTKVVEQVRADPIAVEAVSTVERWSVPALDLAVRVLNNQDAYSHNSKEVQALAQAALHVEKVMASVPRDERPTTEDGRRFSTLRDYSAMPAAQRSRYYTVQEESLVPQLIIKAAQYEAGKIKQDLENRIESYAKQRGYVKSEGNTSPKPTPKPAAQPTAPTVKSTQPSAPSKSNDEGSYNGVPSQFWKDIGIRDL